ncbi:MAG: RNA methyltransferase [Calditrichaeota bacterium]|nr:RNA methyltransferase [Calditrichota bacterium]
MHPTQGDVHGLRGAGLVTLAGAQGFFQQDALHLLHGHTRFDAFYFAQTLDHDVIRLDPPAGRQPLTIAIGPEGGFSEEEIEQARATGFRFLKLNDAILRTETAAVSAISQAKLYLG